MSSTTTTLKSRRGGGDLSASTPSARARSEAVNQRRRIIEDSSDDAEEGYVRPPDDPVPSTSRIRIREDIILSAPVKVVGREAKERKEKAVLDAGEVLDLSNDTEVEREEEEERKTAESGSEETPRPPKVRKRGRPPINPDHEGLFTADAIAERAQAKKELVWEREQIDALDPAKPVRTGARLRKARKGEQELLLEYKEVSAAGLTAIVSEQLATLRRVAQGCSNLKGTTVKALWDTTVSIAAATAALNLRAHSAGSAVSPPEWDDLREELRQLRADMAHLRSSNDTLKEDLRRERAERERLERTLEKEREERNRGKETEPPTSSLPGTGRMSLRPRASRKRMAESEDEDEEMEEVDEGVEAESPVVPDCRPQVGEIIPPAYRPPVKGVVALIEPERPFEGSRPPPDERPVEGRSEGPKPLTIADLSQALETMLPRLLGRMGLTGPVKEAGASLPRPDPGSAPGKGHTSTGGGGGRRLEGAKAPSGGGGAGAVPPLPPASSGVDGPQKKKKKRGGKKKKGGQQAPGTSGTQVPPLPQPTSAPVPPPTQTQEAWTKVVGRREKKGKQAGASAPPCHPCPANCGHGRERPGEQGEAP